MYAGLLRGTNGTSLKDMLILAVRDGDGLSLIVKDKRGYKGVWYTPEEKASCTHMLGKGEWQNAFTRFVKSRRQGQWKLTQCVDTGASTTKRRRCSTRVQEQKKKMQRVQNLCRPNVEGAGEAKRERKGAEQARLK